MDLRLLNTSCNLLEYSKRLSRSLDKEYTFFQNLPDASIYKQGEIAKLRTYVETSFQSIERGKYETIKGYEWFVQNHEFFEHELRSRYEIIKSCCSFLNSCIKHLQALFSGSTLQYILNESTPLPISLLPVDLLCACVQISLQMENLPCEIIAGLLWVFEGVRGLADEDRTIMFPFCSSHCLTILRQECVNNGFTEIAMQLLQKPVYREIQIVENLLYDDNPVLFHQYEENADTPSILSEDSWLFLASYTPMSKHVSMLVLLFPQLTIDSPLVEGESWVVSLLSAIGNESISENCVSNTLADIQTAVSKLPKTKENKAILASVQKSLKRIDPNPIRMERRQRCIDCLHHWAENIHRDPGVLAPYLFVIFSVLSVSLAELEWACINSIRRRRQFLHLSGEKYLQMATSKDDSFPRLLEEFLALRSLLFENLPIMTAYYQTYLTPLQSRIQSICSTNSAMQNAILPLFGEVCLENDWMRTTVQLEPSTSTSTSTSTPSLTNLLWCYCQIRQSLTTPEVVLYARSEIPHLASFYPLMFTFCAENYTRRGNFDFQFHFLDLIDMLRHSRQVIPRQTEMQFVDHRKQILEHLRSHTMEKIAILFANHQRALRGEQYPLWEGVDGEDLARCALMFQRYREVEQDGMYILSTSLIENACVELFTTQLQEQFNQAALCLPTDILQLLQAMRSTLLAIKSYIPALSADAIMDACRKACDLSNYYLNALLQLVNDPTACFCPQTHLFSSSNPLLPSLLTPRQLQVLIQLTDISTVYSYCKRLVETLAQCIRGAREQMHVLAEQGVLHEETSITSNSPAVMTITAIWAQVQNAGLVEYVIAVMEECIQQIMQEQNWMIMPSLWEVEKEYKHKDHLTEKEQACLNTLKSLFVSSPDHGSRLAFEPCRYCIDSMTTMVRERSMDLETWFVGTDEWIVYLHLAFQTNVFGQSRLLETLHGMFLHIRDQASMRLVIDRVLSTLTQKGKMTLLSSVMHTLAIVHCSYLFQHCERYQLLCPLVDVSLAEVDQVTFQLDDMDLSDEED